jgi:hypothetical protein
MYTNNDGSEPKELGVSDKWGSFLIERVCSEFDSKPSIAVKEFSATSINLTVLKYFPNK